LKGKLTSVPAEIWLLTNLKDLRVRCVAFVFSPRFTVDCS